jgi:3-oxoacyl-[acyl-carrier protein] reductase
MNLQLTNKRVFITGSSRGIGLAIARGFLGEGAKVFLTSRNQGDLKSQQQILRQEFGDRKVLIHRGDFTSPLDIKLMRKYVQEEWQGLDILVVNVGSGKSVNDPIPGVDNFEQVFRLNFDSAVYTAREFYPLLKLSQGNMLFIASIAGLEAFGAPVDYSTAKSSVIAFAKNLARKAAGESIRINCLAPGNIFFTGGSWEEKVKMDPEGIKNLVEASVPMKRFGKPEEISDAVLFLCSQRASFITGACLVVDGGQTVGVF